jgi:two-component system sensor histidine kinase YesM
VEPRADGWATAALVILISLLISLGVGYSITRWILRPIYQVILAIDRMDQGDKRGIETLEIHNSDINPLAETLKKMVKNLDMLLERTVKQRVEMTQAQLIALRAQISPHFIYNTLETIRSYSLEYGVKDIDEMAASLARIIRYALQDGEDRVVLREELNYVKNYVRIQQYRFSNRFDIRFDIPEELMDVALPRLIIQPLVENAIVHGVEPVVGKYSICVSARREVDDMVVEVVNDGKAMSHERLRQVRDALSGRENEVSVKGRGGKEVGIGLLNVHSRLRLLYGDAYGLQVDSDEHLTTIRLTLPIPAPESGKDGN